MATKLILFLRLPWGRWHILTEIPNPTISDINRTGSRRRKTELSGFFGSDPGQVVRRVLRISLLRLVYSFLFPFNSLKKTIITPPPLNTLLWFQNLIILHSLEFNRKTFYICFQYNPLPRFHSRRNKSCGFFFISIAYFTLAYKIIKLVKKNENLKRYQGTLEGRNIFLCPTHYVYIWYYIE